MKAIIASLLVAVSAFAVASAQSKAVAPPGPPGALIVDVRTAQEYAEGRIPGSVLFPYDQLKPKSRDFAALVGKDGQARPIVVYCRSGRRSAIAAKTLTELGYRNVIDYGAIDRWKGPLER